VFQHYALFRHMSVFENVAFGLRVKRRAERPSKEQIQRKVFDLLPAEKELGMQLSPAYQLIPEQSTAAIIIHHPQAKYYSIGESRVEQLMK
jgi:ABC-type sulfate/molybdate transport systems ATPase subunit